MPEHRIIAMASPVSIAASEGDESPKGPRAFSSTFYTGGPLSVSGWDMPVVVDLAGLKSGNVLVANLDHDSSKRVGNFELINDGTKLVANGKANAATAARDEVVNSALEGYQWQASLEVTPHKVEELANGKTIEVNGQQITGPAYITRTGTLKGFGFVSHGADDNTNATIAATAASSTPKGKKMDAKFKTWIEAMGFDADSLSDDQIAGLQANYDGKDTPKKKVVAENPFEERKLEAARVRELREIANRYIDTRRSSEEEIDAIEKMHNHAVAAKMTPQEFRLELYESSVPSGVTVSVRADSKKITNNVLKAAICQTAGLGNLDSHFKDQELQMAKDRFRDGLGLKELLVICARDRGMSHEGFNVTLEVQQAAFGQHPQAQVRAGQGFSTYSLPGILSDSANKFLLEGWGGGEMAWEQVSDIISVRDFKTISQYKLSGNLKYEKVGAAGEIKHGTVSEDTYTNKASTYGRMFAITKEHIVNDDLSAFSQVARELGVGANDAFNEVFWTLFLSNPGNFFHSDNKNVSTGTVTSSTVLATLAAAEAIFFAQTKPNGTPVSITPTVILAPNGAYRVFQAAMGSGMVVGSSGPTPNVNVFQGEYNVVRSAYLSNPTFSGYSAAKWYLLARRPGLAVIQAAFLNGQRAPAIESAAAEFSTLGIQMRGVHDFGVSMHEYRAGVQGSGA